MLRLARKIAEKECNGKHRVVAIISDKRGRVVSVGSNSYQKSHPRQAHYASATGLERKIFLHAEIRAIIRAGGSGTKLSVYRFNKNGETRMAAPCEVCQAAIRETKIKIVEYTT